MNSTEILSTLRAALAETRTQAAQLQGVMLGDPFVIRLHPGLYLGPCEGGYCAVGITEGVVCYAPGRVPVVLAALRNDWPEATALDIRDALQHETGETLRLIDTIARLSQAA